MTISQGSRFEARRRSPAQTRRRSGSYAARVAALLAVAVPIVAALAASPALLAGCGTDAGPGRRAPPLPAAAIPAARRPRAAQS
jgi:hypothetical protein